jgi:hypothetical protein
MLRRRLPRHFIEPRISLSQVVAGGSSVHARQGRNKRTKLIMKNMKVTQRILVFCLSVGAVSAFGELTGAVPADSGTAPSNDPAKPPVFAPATTLAPAATPAPALTLAPIPAPAPEAAPAPKFALARSPRYATTGASSSGSRADDDEDLRFHENEWDLSVFGCYVDKAGGKWGVGAAATYFILKNLGVGVATYWTDWQGTFIDNVEAEGYFRLPLLKIIAPYAVGSIGYQFDHDYVFETLGLGVDFRPFKNLDAFADAQYRFTNDGSKNGAFLRLGVRFAF